MFHCYIHGWSDQEKPCSLCNPSQVYSTDTINIPISPTNNIPDELTRLRIEVAQLRQILHDSLPFDAYYTNEQVYYGQLDEENKKLREAILKIKSALEGL